MTYEELKNSLRDINVSPPDIYRASLYFNKIQEVRTFLFEELADDPGIGGVNYAHFKAALQDPTLIDSFCEVIDDFVVGGVNAKLTADRGNYGTYPDFWDRFIFDDNQATYDANVDQFYTDYQATHRALINLTANFKNGILKVCQRVQNNWDDINLTFTDANHSLSRLIRIESTGSDFHKGGVQVLILTFALDYIIPLTLNSFKINPFSNRLKIVYKPTDIEVDCLIAGNSAAVNRIHKEFQVKSLFEIINELIGCKKSDNERLNERLKELPTYNILPYNYGSSLVRAPGGELPIRESYGYIQFLKHEHAPRDSFYGYRFGCGYGASDFKIFPDQDAEKIVKNMYQQIGELLALASSFSMIDLHLENVIVSGYQPYLIDMEICLTRPISALDQTGLFGSHGGITHSERRSRYGGGYVITGQNGDKLLVPRGISTPKQNKLWTTLPNREVNPAAPAPCHAMLNGLEDGFELLFEVVSTSMDLFEAWFRRLKKVVVRVLPYNTQFLETSLRNIYNEFNANMPNYYQTAYLVDYTTEYYNYKGRLDAIKDDPEGYKISIPEPKFLALHGDYINQDYQNCDIPSFYHRIGSRNIMNSAGTKILLPEFVDTNDQNEPPSLVRHGFNIRRKTYYATEPTRYTVKKHQVNILKTQESARVRESALRPSLLTGLGLAEVPEVSDVIH